ncbi:MAG: acylphosphatase [Lachnospiraceae bacterium]|nr:acylphosphatase [Lachnospiraceae bacterium]
MVRKRLTFEGRVQGVGFRYRAYYAAQELRLTGWVKNQWDGSVVMEVQGSEEKIDALISQINNGRFVSISRIDSKSLPVDEEEKSFNIRHYD